MADILFTFEVDDAFTANIVERHFNKAFITAMQGAVLFLESKAADIAPVGVSGNYRAGITSQVFAPVLGHIGVTGIATGYSHFVEVGRAAGRWPPVAPIELWVKRVIRPDAKDLASVTFQVRRKIGTRGVKGQFVFERTVKAWGKNVEKYFLDAAKYFSDLMSKPS